MLSTPGKAEPKVVDTYEAGRYFGELALMYSCPRKATVRVTSKDGGTLWVLNRDTFRQIAQQLDMKKHRRLDFLVNLVPFLKSADVKSKLSDAFSTRFFQQVRELKGFPNVLFHEKKKKIANFRGNEFTQKEIKPMGST